MAMFSSKTRKPARNALLARAAGRPLLLRRPPPPSSRLRLPQAPLPLLLPLLLLLLPLLLPNASADTPPEHDYCDICHCTASPPQPRPRPRPRKDAPAAQPQAHVCPDGPCSVFDPRIATPQATSLPEYLTAEVRQSLLGMPPGALVEVLRLMVDKARNWVGRLRKRAALAVVPELGLGPWRASLDDVRDLLAERGARRKSITELIDAAAETVEALAATAAAEDNDDDDDDTDDYDDFGDFCDGGPTASQACARSRSPSAGRTTAAGLGASSSSSWEADREAALAPILQIWEALIPLEKFLDKAPLKRPPGGGRWADRRQRR